MIFITSIIPYLTADRVDTILRLENCVKIEVSIFFFISHMQYIFKILHCDAGARFADNRAKNKSDDIVVARVKTWIIKAPPTKASPIETNDRECTRWQDSLLVSRLISIRKWPSKSRTWLINLLLISCVCCLAMRRTINTTRERGVKRQWKRKDAKMRRRLWNATLLMKSISMWILDLSNLRFFNAAEFRLPRMPARIYLNLEQTSRKMRESSSSSSSQENKFLFTEKKNFIVLVHIPYWRYPKQTAKVKERFHLSRVAAPFPLPS